MRDFCSYVHSMNRTYAYLRNDRKIKFRMVSAQHFINEAPDACQWCSGSVNHSPSSSVISPYSVYVASEILCTVIIGYR